ncbi:MAG: TIGR00730 family Rossman fold protein [Gammaproteobacteria bacterium]|nr:TIGR00730 family Rossman fold protein [Gammaproteobacteria bacterium]
MDKKDLSELKAEKRAQRKDFGWEHRSTKAERSFFWGHRKLPKEVWRAFRVFLEACKGFLLFHYVTNCVTVFGSARFPEGHEYYEAARRIGQLLAENHFTVMTGGGPGIMEAANRGAKEKGGRTIGCNIEILQEQDPNPYLDRWITFRYFFIRKVMLTKFSRAFVVMPGGLGTLDEFFELVTLIQTRKITTMPMILYGTSYWQPLLDYMENTLAKLGTIDITDVRRIAVTDSPEEIIEFINLSKPIQLK